MQRKSPADAGLCAFRESLSQLENKVLFIDTL